MLCEFEGAGFEGEADFPQIGVNLLVLGPGSRVDVPLGARPRRFSRARGGGAAIVEGEERPLAGLGLRALPGRARTRHRRRRRGPCVVLAVGARDRSTGPDWGAYTVDEAAHATARRRAGDDRRARGVRPLCRAQARAYREGWLPDQESPRHRATLSGGFRCSIRFGAKQTRFGCWSGQPCIWARSGSPHSPAASGSGSIVFIALTLGVILWWALRRRPSASTPDPRAHMPTASVTFSSSRTRRSAARRCSA